MKQLTIFELKKKGYQITPSSIGIGCTDICSPNDFFYANPKFLRDICDIGTQMNSAECGDDGLFRIIVAGEYDDNEVFPLAILTPDQACDLEKIRLDAAEADEQVAAAEKERRDVGVRFSRFLDL